MDIDNTSTISDDMEIDHGSKRSSAPWVEKYRPQSVDDVSHQEEVTKTLKKAIEQGSIPHLLFYGPPGTGKTTTALALARSIYGPELYKTRILELNASDERGIKVVREKIKVFAQAVVGNQKSSGYRCPRFKMIILDEADTMTPDAQSALRRIIEQYSKVTRFCLICNYVTRIIEPLASRCAKFRFQPLSPESMASRIRHIASSEGVAMSEDGLETLLQLSRGDMRKAVTCLQSAHQLYTSDTVVTHDLVLEIVGQVPESVMTSFWEAVNSSFDALQSQVSHIINQGYPIANVLLHIHERIVAMDCEDIKKAMICDKIARVEQCLVDGASEYLQLMDVAAFILRQIQGFTVNGEGIVH